MSSNILLLYNRFMVLFMPMVNSQIQRIVIIAQAIASPSNNFKKQTSASVRRSSLLKSMLPPPVPMPDTLVGVDDLIRSDLEKFAGHWFWALLGFTLLVALGLMFEFPEIWHDTIGALKEMCRCPTVKRKLSPWSKLAGTFGWILIIAGVVGEGVAEGFLFKADGLVVKFDEILLADTTKSAGAARKSAIKAADAAKIAKDQSDAAVQSSLNALGLAKGARKEVHSFEADIVSAKKLAADAESHLADALQQAANAEEELTRIKTPRSLIHVDELVAALKPFSGSEYTLNVFMDDESIQFTKAVAGALGAAGWVRKQPAGIDLGIPTVTIVFGQGASENVPACLDTGISLHAHAKESVAVLQSRPLQSLPKTIQAALALRSAITLSISPPDERNVARGILDPKPEEGVLMTICVGKKP